MLDDVKVDIAVAVCTCVSVVTIIIGGTDSCYGVCYWKRSPGEVYHPHARNVAVCSLVVVVVVVLLLLLLSFHIAVAIYFCSNSLPPINDDRDDEPSSRRSINYYQS